MSYSYTSVNPQTVSYSATSVNPPTVQATSYTSTVPALSTNYQTTSYQVQPTTNLSYSYTAGSGPFATQNLSQSTYANTGLSYTTPSTVSYVSSTAPVERTKDLSFTVERNQQAAKSSAVPRGSGWNVHPDDARNVQTSYSSYSSYSNPSTVSYVSTAAPVERTKEFTFAVDRNQQVAKSSAVPRSSGWKVDAADAHANYQSSLSTHTNNLRTIGGGERVVKSSAPVSGNYGYSATQTSSPGSYTTGYSTGYSTGLTSYANSSPSQTRAFDYEFTKPPQVQQQAKERAKNSAAIVRNIHPDDMHEHHRAEHYKKSALPTANTNVRVSSAAPVSYTQVSAPQSYSYTQTSAPVSYTQVSAPQTYTQTSYSQVSAPQSYTTSNVSYTNGASNYSYY